MGRRLLSLLAAAFSRRGLREVSAAAERSGMEIVCPFENRFLVLLVSSDSNNADRKQNYISN